MASKTNTTTDHDEIRRWAGERDGKPAIVKGTEDGGGGVLRIDFPGGASGDRFDHVDWDEWFRIFDESDLAAILQEEKASGEDSTFIKLVSRENA